MFSRGMVMGWVIILGLAGIFGGGCPGQAQATEHQWVCKVVSLQGDVQVRRKGLADWGPLRLSDTLSAGDRVSVKANSRVGLVLRNDAVLRLDQHTTLVFTEIEKESTFVFNLLKGAANFFSRRPRSLKIFTPFVNGVVEGTEFYVQVDDDQTRIDLFEGRILAQNSMGELQLAKGQGLVASAGVPLLSSKLVQPRDSVQWALYYPPILAVGPDDVPEELGDSMARFKQGRADEAIAALDWITDDSTDVRISIFKAGLLLHVGRVHEAREAIQQVLLVEPDNSNALALKAIIAVVQNRKDEALAVAQKAVQLYPSSATAHLSLSYAHQAAFNLPQALTAAKSATIQAPENGTAWARLAELQLSTGALDQGVQSAQKATALDPQIAHAQTILGFAYLTQIKTKKAQQVFEKAIVLDSAAPLPRLGLGLAKIRDGKLAQGRAQIEIAAGLDPVNALIRSYLGKAYFDEIRGPLDAKQLEIAKDLDPQDPTPWFYDALRKQSLNRPVEALQDMRQSIKLNDNRAVYRSRLLLDDDLGARSAALGRIYTDLSLEELALQHGWRSLNRDPSNFSAHRLLADLYVDRPRHEIARVSELLQAQLMQPLNLAPVQTQLAESNLQILEGSGPSAIGYNEYNNLFVRDRIRLGLGGVAGSFGNLGDEVIVSGVEQRLSFSLGRYHYESDGFRDNNDLEHDIYNGFIQAAISDKANLQMEYRNRDTQSGDLKLLFSPDTFSPSERRDIDRQRLRLGMKLALNPSQDMIASVMYSDFETRLKDRIEVSEPGFIYISDSANTIKGDAVSGEVQHIYKARRFSLISGVGCFSQNEENSRVKFESLELPPDPPDSGTTFNSLDFDGDHFNAYFYLNSTAIENLEVSIGLAFDAMDSRLQDDDLYSPKIGLLWSLSDAVTLRAAWFQTLKRAFIANQTIEPTHVAGFNQFFDDSDGTETERYGTALDARLSERFFAGLETTWRDARVPSININNGTRVVEDQEEQQHAVYVNWIPVDQVSIRMAGWYENRKRFTFAPTEVETYRAPLSLNYFSPNGITSKLTATYIDQKFTDQSTAESDAFWVVDTSIGFRFPNRMGGLTVAVKNLFNTSFNYYDNNYNTGEPVLLKYWPERLILVQCSLSF